MKNEIINETQFRFAAHFFLFNAMNKCEMKSEWKFSDTIYVRTIYSIETRTKLIPTNHYLVERERWQVEAYNNSISMDDITIPL